MSATMTAPSAPTTKTMFDVDQNFHQESVYEGDVLIATTIETSEFIELTMDTGYDPYHAGVVPVAATCDYTVRGDVVRVVGPIHCPGRTVVIVCRRLELLPDTAGELSGVHRSLIPNH